MRNNIAYTQTKTKQKNPKKNFGQNRAGTARHRRHQNTQGHKNQQNVPKSKLIYFRQQKVYNSTAFRSTFALKA
jgi:hypothetical protein